MKALSLSLLLVCLFMSTTLFAAQDTSSQGIIWTTDYAQALDQARKDNKSLVLLFTGSDWCSYCHKLEREVLGKNEFSKEAGGKFVFVKLDYPKQSKLDPRTNAQNKNLLQKYNVNAFPTVIVIDQNERFLGIPNYESWSPGIFAKELDRMNAKR